MKQLLFSRIILQSVRLPTIRASLPRKTWCRPFTSTSLLTAEVYDKASFFAAFHDADKQEQKGKKTDKMGEVTGQKRNFGGRQGRHQKSMSSKRQKRKQKAMTEGSSEEVLLIDVQNLLAKTRISEEDESAVEGETAKEEPPLPEQGSEIEVEVVELSSTGDGLARQSGSDRIYVVPFSIPGDTVKVKVYRHLQEEQYSVADFISVVKPSPLRDDSRIQCPYFAKCSGCQFQMMDYSDQLAHKKTIVEKAYKNFSNLDPSVVPPILDTFGSPLQYGYRTKLTPHFDQPPGATRHKRVPFTSCPPVGYTGKGSKKVLDIEDCPIGTPAVRAGLKAERERMTKEFANYTRGATILLRENTIRTPKGNSEASVPGPSGSLHRVETDTYIDDKTCETDNNATTTEYIDDFVFTNRAGDFFQNNNSILSPFTAYVRDHIRFPVKEGEKQIKYLIDAYSGSGLFTITLSPSLFPTGGTSIGIDIAEKSIACARRNAELNGLSNCKFVAADANELFKSVKEYDPDETVVVLDPPRKGCDAGFLRQLLEFRPKRVVGYVEGEKEGKSRYEIESIRGFDFFPQTGHVEGVAVLNRVDKVEPGESLQDKADEQPESKTSVEGQGAFL
ncbi:tRNA(m5U54)methyltransferase [Coniochaeta pulveracea]|uniref:tRNA(M5U54)methyltransferase n=1 Tax=Coniochaeta pulveracea TaxID=177199 RepID=A0A420YGI6_9PEZI|nr:tRNA(m5U54)methyltransferase [Coniochaeta pulveracea]